MTRIHIEYIAALALALAAAAGLASARIEFADRSSIASDVSVRHPW